LDEASSNQGANYYTNHSEAGKKSQKFIIKGHKKNKNK
jgi:hypothetical protein